MRFAYYNRLSAASKKIYRQSDAIEIIRLPAGHGLESIAAELAIGLEDGDKRRVTKLSGELAGEICACLDTPPLRVRVMEKRPSSEWEELHGLYQPEEGGEPAVITVWMKTAKRRQVVAFRTFLRTLLHELCHHLDYEYLQLEESFHTESFYKRESGLFRQLVPENDKVSD